ncbi:MAG: FkbM family methyltransferase [Solirubrobacteraceae bacterium]
MHLVALGLEVPGGEHELEVELRPDLNIQLRMSDSILFEVIGFGSYDFDLTPAGPIGTVIDAGANIGLATIALSRHVPNARFVSVEPVASSFALLSRNLRVNVSNAQAVEAAVTAKPGTVEIRPGKNSMTNRAILTDQAGIGSVRGVTIPELLDEVGLEHADLLKLDIEGGEAELFENLDSWIDRIGAIITEIHAPLSVDQVTTALRQQGFQRVALPALPRFDDIIFAVRP